MEEKTVIGQLAALAQATRLGIVRELVAAHAPEEDAGGLAAGMIAERLDVSAPTMSFHLKELDNCGLVQVRREGRSLIYKADIEAIRALAGYLLDDCCAGVDGPACGDGRKAKADTADLETSLEAL